MRIPLLAAAAAATLLLNACGASDTDSHEAGSDSGDKISSTKKESEEPEETGPDAEIVDHAFVQDGEYGKGIVLVRANNADAVGKFVTVSYNVLDAGGKILTSEEQIETFSWVGQEIGYPIFAPLDATPGANATSIDPVVTIGDESFGEEYSAPLPVLEAQSVAKDQYGNGYTVSFGFTNETDAELEGLRVAAVCFDAAGKVIGGDSTYPDALPGRAIRIDVEYLRTVDDQQPASCKGYVNYPA
ncbi:hypothetical protein [Nocardioides sp. L-11A]|uniref:hypothetical protein n=1 Tax=Nocardioides sp. L-11A TaxID=3043848 RepID=UPI00249B8BAC|nr:hypothetical protein QJ852_18345 [Nocardioides sp. L-11A]